MNTALLDKPLVLALNRSWQAIGHRTVKQALVALNGGADGIAPAVALDIAYPILADGTPDYTRLSSVVPVPWAQWIELPVRAFDLSVNTPRRQIRVPTVIIATHYDRMPMAQPRLTRRAIFQRDGGVCQYTGEQVGWDEGNLDHVVPRDRGGRDSFENLVWSRREVNSRKANRLPHEAGLRLIRPPSAPKPRPVAAMLGAPKHPDWRHFLPSPS